MKEWQRLGYGKKRQGFPPKLPSIQFIKHVKSTEVMRNKAFISHIAVKRKHVAMVAPEADRMSLR